MRYLSVCSGIESATVAWQPLGWQAVAFSEIEPYPCALLKHHYPDVPNWGDMTKFKEWPDADIDLLVGGTPCQSFSVAGLRKGLDDPRGNLMLTYLAIAGRYRPKWLVWENVPGVLSSSGGRDFGSFLGGLAELGYGFAYRILDAQHFGVPQRRRRVFVVGCAGDWRRAAAVLFERHSLSGHPAPSREARESIAPAVAPSLRAQSQTSHRLDSDAYVAVHGTQDPCVGDVAFSLGRNSGQENAVALSVALRGRDGGSTAELGDEVGNTLRASGGGGDKPYVLAQAVAWSEELTAHTELAGTIQRGGSGGRHDGVMQPDMQVRRLTPTECERLQGFPDVKKSAIINIVNNEIESICYLDLQKSNVNAGTRCLRSQSNVLNAGEGKSKYRARSAEQSLSAPQAELKKHAQVTVLIDLEQGILQILNQKRPILNVRIAEKQSLCPLHIQPEDFVQLSVAMLSELEKKAQTGKGESRQNIISFIAQKSGRKLAGGFGLETEEYAKDVEKLTKEVKSYMKFTTSGAGLNFQSSEQKLAILFYCVASAINLYIQEKTSLGSSYALKIETTIGYTAIPWRNKPAEDCPDGHRYKALGNSKAVPVVRWIAERIAAVERISK